MSAHPAPRDSHLRALSARSTRLAHILNRRGVRVYHHMLDDGTLGAAMTDEGLGQAFDQFSLPFLSFERSSLRLIQVNDAARRLFNLPNRYVSMDVSYFLDPLEITGGDTWGASRCESPDRQPASTERLLDSAKAKLDQLVARTDELAFGQCVTLHMLVDDTLSHSRSPPRSTPAGERSVAKMDVLVTTSDTGAYSIVLLRPSPSLPRNKSRGPTPEQFKLKHDLFLSTYGIAPSAASLPPSPNPSSALVESRSSSTESVPIRSGASPAPSSNDSRHVGIDLPHNPNYSDILETLEIVTEKVSTKKSSATKGAGRPDSPLTRKENEVRNGAEYDMMFDEAKAIMDEEEEPRKLLTHDELTRLVDTMPQICFTAEASGQVDWFNEAWYQYTGLSESESMDFSNWVNMFHPKDLENVLPVWVEAIGSGSDFRFQYRVKGADGVLRWCVCQGRACKDLEGTVLSWACSITQVEDLVAAQAQAQRLRDHVRAVLSGAETVLMTFDRDGMVTFFEGSDRAARAAAGLRAVVGAVGTNYKDIYSEPRLITEVEAILKEEKTVSDLMIDRVDEDGRVYHCRFRLVPLRHTESTALPSRKPATTESDDRPDGVIIVATDVTELVEKEEALRKAELERAQLQASETAAQESNRLKTEFLTTISHEIRSPISAILGICELLLDDQELRKDSRTLVNKAMRSGELLLDLIGMVLDLRKIEVAELVLEESPLEIHDLLADAQVFSVVAAKKGILFVEDIEDLYSGYVLGDRLRLRQILTNSLSNAVKFSHPQADGQLTLRVRQEHETADAVHLLIEVKDTGIGIDPKILPTLFQPFRQADASTARKFGGSGLGLVIVKNLIELMNGSVSLESTLGSGTTMRLRVPLKKARQDKCLEHPAPGSAVTDCDLGTGRRPENVRILLADDNDLIREIITRTLAKMRFNVTAVADGQRAIEAIEAEPFDLILMDGQMGGLDGYQATMQIRRSAQRRVREVKIVALTASAIQGDKERCIQAGMDDYLAKPVRAQKLQETIWNNLQAM